MAYARPAVERDVSNSVNQMDVILSKCKHMAGFSLPNFHVQAKRRPYLGSEKGREGTKKQKQKTYEVVMR